MTYFKDHCAFLVFSGFFGGEGIYLENDRGNTGSAEFFHKLQLLHATLEKVQHDKCWSADDLDA